MILRRFIYVLRDISSGYFRFAFMLIAASCAMCILHSAPLDGTGHRVRFRYLSGSEGMGYDVTSILQDKHGIMMISSWDGLRFFDGYEIENMRYSLDTPEGLPSNRVVFLREDRDRSVWVGYDSGISRYFPDTREFVNYTGALGELHSYKILTIDVDVQGNVWIGAEEDLITGFDTGDGKYSFGVIENFPSPSIRGICCSEDGNVWIGTVNGLYRFRAGDRDTGNMEVIGFFRDRAVKYIYCDDEGAVWVGYDNGLAVCPPGGEFRRINFKPDTNPRVDCIIRDKDHNLWVGTRTEGLFMLSFDGGYRLTGTVAYNSASLFGRLSNDRVSSLFIDASNVLWVGTRRGLNYADLTTPRFYMVSPLIDDMHSEFGYKGKHINNLFIDSEDKLWICTLTEGIFTYDINTGAFNEVTDRITRSTVNRMTETGDGSIWITSHEGFHKVWRMGNGNYASRKIYLGPGSEDAWKFFSYYNDVCCDFYGKLWISTIQGLLRYDPENETWVKYTRADGLASDFPSCLLSDPDTRTVWVGSADNGLTRITYDEKGIVRTSVLNTKGSMPFKLSHDQVWSIMKSSDNVIWVGMDSGLDRIEYAGERIVDSRRITVPLLKDERILAITEDLGKNIWINSNKGLICYDPASEEAVCYISDDGLQSSNFTEAATRAPNGFIYAGGANGVNYFNPAHFRNNPYPGRPILTHLKIFNRSVEPREEYDGKPILTRVLNSTEKITLNYEQNNFVIEFSSDHYAIPEKNTFRYMLKGYDPDWIETDSRRRFTSYENLPAGNYRFLVTSANNDGIPSSVVRELDIAIRPAPWASWWAWTLYALFVCGALLVVIFYFHSRSKWKRKLFVREIEQQKQDELNEMKLNFYTNITHELRTPLTLIDAPLRDLRDKEYDDYADFRLKIIERNANKLSFLINQLLDIRKVSGHTLPLAVSYYDIHNTVKSVVDSFSYLSEQAGIYLRFIPPDQATKGWFDIDKIEKVLHNLVSNAFKFTPRNGTIEIRLWSDTPAGASPRFAFVSVKDSGTGISQKELPKIFDLFYHGTPLSGESSGVGLSLSKAIMELHGGAIDVKSAEGEGATFTISFRIDQEAYRHEYLIHKEETAVEKPDRPDEEAIYEEVASLSDQRDKYLILVVEDNDDMKEYLTESLRENFRVVGVTDGQLGLSVAQKMRPDLVITDMMMPNMDGLEFIRNMKSNPRTNYIPIMVHSVRSDKKSILEAFGAGAQDYIVKPFEAQTLTFRIGNLLNTRKHFAHKLKAETIIKPSEVDVPSQDEMLLHKITAIVEENLTDPMFGVDKLASLLGMSRTQLYRRIKGIAGGKNALEMIRDIRIQRAAQLLSTGQLRVIEVMYQVGMNNHYRFVRYFQEAYGVSPKEYINKFRRPDGGSGSEEAIG